MFEAYLNGIPLMQIENLGLRIIFGFLYMVGLLVAHLLEVIIRSAEALFVPILNVPLGLFNKRFVISHFQTGGLYYSGWMLATSIKPWEKFVASEMNFKLIFDRPSLTLSQNF